MIYDEFCFERHNDWLEKTYLSKEVMNNIETRKCCAYDCPEEAAMRLDGNYYCHEHGHQMIKEYGHMIEEINGLETFESNVPELAGSEIEKSIN